ncbi:MAG: DNA adenine methylase [Thermoproteota archaeon]
MLEGPEERLTKRPVPFVKWAGGKGQLLQDFEKYFPPEFGTYYEPFLGGGAVFFHLLSKKRIRKAVISDLNKDLINCYVAIRDHIDELLQQLRRLQRHAKDKDFYYNKARKRFNEINLNTGLEGNIEKAALLIYLNKTCYNGLYRVNKKGEFNVPWGRYKNPNIYDEENLLAINRVLRLKDIVISCDDYQQVVKNAGKGDFIYLDPPYQPISPTANFTEYTSESFTIADQQRLAEVFRQLSSRGCMVMLSNSPKVYDLYNGYTIVKVNATRAISCVGSRRGPVEELLIMSY